jgi:hypothetical protein
LTCRILLAVGLLSLALGVAGCGSHAVTKAQVITRADAICTDTLRAVRASETGSPGVSGVVPLISREVSRLKALPRPAEDRALLASYLGAMSTELRQWRALASAQAGGSSARTSAALAALSHNQAPQLAARYGMPDCAGAGATVGSAATASTAG